MKVDPKLLAMILEWASQAPSAVTISNRPFEGMVYWHVLLYRIENGKPAGLFVEYSDPELDYAVRLALTGKGLL